MAGWKIHTFGWYLPGKMVIFHCYVSFQMILVSTLISSSDALVGHRPRCLKVHVTCRGMLERCVASSINLWAWGLVKKTATLTNIDTALQWF